MNNQIALHRSFWFPNLDVEEKRETVSGGACCRGLFTPSHPYFSSLYFSEVLAPRLPWLVDPVVVAPSEDLVGMLLTIFITYRDKNTNTQ